MTEDYLVSIVLITYNQKNFIKEALSSSFLQNYEPLEIIISDDCSTDGTYDIVKEQASIYKGPHKLVLNRNSKNLGIAGNLNRAFALTKGYFIVAQAGDDISCKERVKKIMSRFRDISCPVDLVASYFAEIDVSGNLTGFIKKDIAFTPDLTKNYREWRCGATGACAAYNRKLFDKYGPIDADVLSEDWVYSFRAWLEAGIDVIEEPLVKHRTHEAALGFMQGNFKKCDSRTRRYRRLQGAKNRLAISREWLRGYRISGRNDLKIERQLEDLVRLRKLEVDAFSANKAEAFKLALAVVKAGGNYKDMLRIVIRHVLELN